MPIVGEPKHFHTKFKFQLDIDGVGSMQFQDCSELSVEVAKIEYYEGGVIRPYKEPGRMNVSDLTLNRAATEDLDLWYWLEDTVNASTNSGLRSTLFKRGGYIIQYDRDNTILRRWQLYGLWPTKMTVGAWDNNSDEMTIEQIVLAVDYFELRNNVLQSATQNLNRLRSALGRAGGL